MPTQKFWDEHHPSSSTPTESNMSNTQALVNRWTEAKASKKRAEQEVVEAQNEMLAIIPEGEHTDLGISIKNIPASEGRLITQEEVGTRVGIRKAHYRVALIFKDKVIS